MLSTVEKRKKVDSLIDHLWSHGYLTLSRRYGKFLPNPSPLGKYEVDAIAKYKKRIAIGLVLSEEELNNPNIVTKLIYLANSHPKNIYGKTTLFIGVQNKNLIKAHMILATLDEKTRERIKIVSLDDEKKSKVETEHE